MEQTDIEGHPILKAWTQLVNLPLQAVVILMAVWLAMRATRRERVMLGWFIAGLVSMFTKRVIVLLRDGEPAWYIFLDDGLLPTVTSACFATSLYLWWRDRGKPLEDVR